MTCAEDKYRGAHRLALMLGMVAIGGWFLAGCGGKPPQNQPKVDPKQQTTDKEKGEPPTKDKQEKVDPKEPPKIVTPAAHEAFAKLIEQAAKGQLTHPQLTVAFKATLAPARPGFDGDQQAGCNETAIADYLTKLTGSYGKPDTPITSGSQVYLTVPATEAGKGGLLIRFQEVDSQWKIDWISRRLVGAPALEDRGMPVEGIAHVFLESLLNGDDLATAAVMGSGWREDLAPPRKSDAHLGYNPGFLKLKLKDLRGDYTNFTITYREPVAPGSGHVALVGELIGSKKFAYSMMIQENEATKAWVVTRLREKQ